MNQVQSALFLLLQESFWVDFKDPQNNQELQDFISTRFLELYKRVVADSEEKNVNLNIGILKKINEDNLNMRASNSPEFSSSIDNEDNTSATEISESGLPTTENHENSNGLNSDEDFLFIAENSDDVKPILMIGDVDNEEELKLMFPDHTYRISRIGFEKIVSGIARGANVIFKSGTCLPGSKACKPPGTYCPSGIAMSAEELQRLIQTASEAIRKARTDNDLED